MLKKAKKSLKKLFILGYGLFYPPQALGPEVTMVVLFFFWQFGRIYIGFFIFYKKNKWDFGNFKKDRLEIEQKPRLR